ncbi:hypothetical protein [Streptomyces sp. GS7]|uniref:hypothetical protein n=1 Tax=Streptomyces sp. GS7 TaxID=2692234 RepID=UPI001317C80E|nr:hypothetical protein [Streptomyces sp. GS7]QHC24518.1 hypothetical protein GR130_27240 [Streptomyces sp. GS7]
MRDIELRTPFTPRISPDLETARIRNLEWLTSTGALTSTENQARCLGWNLAHRSPDSTLVQPTFPLAHVWLDHVLCHPRPQGGSRRRHCDRDGHSPPAGTTET